jgi:hypothetical protein
MCLLEESFACISFHVRWGDVHEAELTVDGSATIAALSLTLDVPDLDEQGHPRRTVRIGANGAPGLYTFTQGVGAAFVTTSLRHRHVEHGEETVPVAQHYLAGTFGP